MLFIKSLNTDPYFNLAAEEYLLKHTDHEAFMLWKSVSSVVVGKHQNTYDEINYRYVKSKNIKIARRLSGGGAVYHDPGNINFTFVRTKESGKQIHFKEATYPVVEFLRSLLPDVYYGDKNDICINGRKISGNAEHVYKNRVLHHGTLLFSSDLTVLKKSLDHVEGKYSGHAVQSNRSDIVNISELSGKQISIPEFENRLISFINGSIPVPYEFSSEENIQINELMKNKYSSREWIFGYSPDYSLSTTFKDKEGDHKIILKVKRGMITDCKINPDIINHLLTGKIRESLTGTLHMEKEIRQKLTGVLTSGEKELMDMEGFIFGLF